MRRKMVETLCLFDAISQLILKLSRSQRYPQVGERQQKVSGDWCGERFTESREIAQFPRHSESSLTISQVAKRRCKVVSKLNIRFKTG